MQNNIKILLTDYIWLTLSSSQLGSLNINIACFWKLCLSKQPDILNRPKRTIPISCFSWSSLVEMIYQLLQNHLLFHSTYISTFKDTDIFNINWCYRTCSMYIYACPKGCKHFEQLQVIQYLYYPNLWIQTFSKTINVTVRKYLFWK